MQEISHNKYNISLFRFESFIIDGARSPIGLKNGQMVGVRSDDLAAMVIKGLMKRNLSYDRNNEYSHWNYFLKNIFQKTSLYLFHTKAIHPF